MIHHCFRHTKNGHQPAFTDCEVLTCYLFATGWWKCDGAKACHELMSSFYADWFPNIPSYQAFNHRLNRLAEALPIFTNHCFEQLRQTTGYIPTHDVLTDSFPVVTARGCRRNTTNCGVITNKGRCATKRMWYYGVKVHLGAFEQSGTLPLPYYLVISPASTHDKVAQEDHLREIRYACVIADKAYVDRSLKQHMKENDSDLLTPPRYGRGTKEREKQLDGAANRISQTLISKLRQPIESFFAWLHAHVNIEKASRIRSYRGLLVHIYGKIAAAICKHKLAIKI